MLLIGEESSARRPCQSAMGPSKNIAGCSTSPRYNRELPSYRTTTMTSNSRMRPSKSVLGRRVWLGSDARPLPVETEKAFSLPKAAHNLLKFATLSHFLKGLPYMFCRNKLAIFSHVTLKKNTESLCQYGRHVFSLNVLKICVTVITHPIS